MSHPSERDLVLFLSDDCDDSGAIRAHVEACPRCRDEVEELRRLIAAAAASAPGPAAGFEDRLWQAQRRHLALRSVPGGAAAAGRPPAAAWRWVAAAGALAASLVLAILLGRGTAPVMPGNGQPQPLVATEDLAAGGDRILLFAVSEQLRRSRLLLAELANSPTEDATTIAWQQQRAAALVSDSRLFRQSARLRGRPEMASLLEEVERLLLEVARAPSDVEQQQAWRQRIRDGDLLFKVTAAEVGTRTSRRKPSA